MDVELCETGDHDAIEAAVARGCDLLYLETPTNPTLKVLDLGRLCAAGRAAGAGLARYLHDHPGVEQVHYPGLADDPGHEIASRQMSGFGGLVSFTLPGGLDAVRRFVEKLRFAHRAASLGSVGTLIGPPAVTSHVELTAAERAELGIPETLIRCSVGIENLDDLREDFAQALG